MRSHVLRIGTDPKRCPRSQDAANGKSGNTQVCFRMGDWYYVRACEPHQQQHSRKTSHASVIQTATYFDSPKVPQSSCKFFSIGSITLPPGTEAAVRRSPPVGFCSGVLMVRPETECNVLRYHSGSKQPRGGTHHFHTIDGPPNRPATTEAEAIVRRDVVDMVRSRLATGYYSTPEALRQTAEAMLLSQMEAQ